MKRRILVSAVLPVLLLAALAANVHAAEVKITASDGAADDLFGGSVAISGDYAIVGAWADDDAGSNSGSAYIFKRDGVAWTELDKITASDGAADDYFGISVAISGDYAIVGATGDGDAGSRSGSAYIFKRDGTAWTEQAKITASDGAADDRFGYSVAISGDYAVVGAHADNDAGSRSGSAYIFKLDGTTWTEEAKITASDGAADDWFGVSVAISGDCAVVGAYKDNDAGENSGSAYIFKRDGTVWTEQAKITASDGAAYDRFGLSVAISGDYAVVGAYLDNDAGYNSGSSYIFKRDGTAWTQEAKITASDGAALDRFGASVAISCDYTVVGAYWDDDAGSDSGSAYIFKRDGTAWTEQAKITASDGAADDGFGYRVAISGDCAIVGAHWDDDAGTDSGSAYIYTIGIASCDSDGNPKDQFAPGETVYVTGTNLPASTSYKLWIQNEAVSDGDALATGEDPSGTQESVSTDTSGTLPVTAIWTIDPDAAVTYTEYDIVADNQAAGTAGTYNASSDLLDSASTAGFVAPVPGTYVFTTADAVIALQIAVGSLLLVCWYLPDISDITEGRTGIAQTDQQSKEVKQQMKRRILVSTVLSVLLLAALAANVHTAEMKINASDGAANDLFGSRVAISGDYGVVGARGAGAAGSNSGSAYIFKRDGAAWTEQAKISASDGAADDYFGDSVAIAGDYVVVGACGDGDAGSNSGSAYIFKRDGAAWTEQAKISASDGAEGDWFGISVAISGDYVVVGARGAADAGSNSGSAYIFKRDGTTWTEQAKINASDGAADDYFGDSVAISGDYGVVGAQGNDDAGSWSGSAYIFKRDGTAWTQEAKISASDGAAGDYFGVSVAISCGYVVVGAKGDADAGSNSGSAYIFKRDGTAWTEHAKIRASDGAAGDWFGSRVAISGDYAVVGAFLSDADAGPDSGSAYIFKRDGTTWTEHAKICASDGEAYDQFGVSVAISGDYTVSGAYWADDSGLRSGSAYIFTIGMIDSGTAIAHTEYGIVADNQAAGVAGTYNASSDLLDSRSVAGIVASVPELATVVMLTLVGLLALAGYFRYNRRKD
jgi:hypothetical protein